MLSALAAPCVQTSTNTLLAYSSSKVLHMEQAYLLLVTVRIKMLVSRKDN